MTDVRFAGNPYGRVESTTAFATGQSNSTLGFNIGADIFYYFSDTVGIGWLIRYSRGTVGLPSCGGSMLDIQAGGLQTAAGLRLRF